MNFNFHLFVIYVISYVLERPTYILKCLFELFLNDSRSHEILLLKDYLKVLLVDHVNHFSEIIPYSLFYIIY